MSRESLLRAAAASVDNRNPFKLLHWQGALGPGPVTRCEKRGGLFSPVD